MPFDRPHGQLPSESSAASGSEFPNKIFPKMSFNFSGIRREGSCMAVLRWPAAVFHPEGSGWLRHARTLLNFLRPIYAGVASHPRHLEASICTHWPGPELFATALRRKPAPEIKRPFPWFDITGTIFSRVRGSCVYETAPTPPYTTGPMPKPARHGGGGPLRPAGSWVFLAPAWRSYVRPANPAAHAQL